MRFVSGAPAGSTARSCITADEKFCTSRMLIITPRGLELSRPGQRNHKDLFRYEVTANIKVIGKKILLPMVTAFFLLPIQRTEPHKPSPAGITRRDTAAIENGNPRCLMKVTYPLLRPSDECWHCFFVSRQVSEILLYNSKEMNAQEKP